MTTKLSAIAPSPANLAASGRLVGVTGAAVDVIYTAAQVAYFVRNPIQSNKGNVASGTVTFDVSLSTKQRLQLSGNLTIAFSNWPASGTYGEVELELINAGTRPTWPTINWVIGDGTTSTTFSDMSVTLQNAGTNHVTVWSTTGGATLYGRAS